MTNLQYQARRTSACLQNPACVKIAHHDVMEHDVPALPPNADIPLGGKLRSGTSRIRRHGWRRTVHRLTCHSKKQVSASSGATGGNSWSPKCLPQCDRPVEAAPGRGPFDRGECVIELLRRAIPTKDSPIAGVRNPITPSSLPK